MIRNPLAEPYLLGLSGGAGLGAVIAIAPGPTGAWAVPVAAFLGALAAVALVYRLSLVAGRRLDPRVLLLSGVVVGSFAGALMSAIIVLSPRRRHPQRLPLAARRVRRGLVAGARAFSSPMPCVPLAVIGLSARSLDLLALGEEPAHHLGADVHRTRRLVYLCTALLTAASVATCGIIGFVGLVVPHAVRTVRAAAAPLAAAAGVRGRRVVPGARGRRRPHRGAAARAAGRRHHRAGRRAAVRGAAPADARVILEARGRHGALPGRPRVRRSTA